MSETKKIQPTPVTTQSKEKKTKKRAKTFRFDLSLGESNAKTCPEYSFAELVRNEKPEADDDPFNDGIDDREVAAIAQKFEQKYGKKSSYSGKKKRTRDMDDYYDLGDGYDEDDPFIDNSEAYDEVIPSALTTKHGGFYINQGQLDFKSVSDDSLSAFASPQTTPVAKKKKKNVLDSDSEEETGEALAKKFKAMKRKRLLESKEGEKKKKVSDAADGDAVVKKKKKKNPQKLLLKKLAKQNKSKANSTAPATPSSPGNINTPIPSSAAGPALSINGNVDTKPPLMALSVNVSSAMASPAISVTTTAGTETEVTSANAPKMNGTKEIKTEGLTGSAVDLIEGKISGVLQDAIKEESSSKSGDEAKGEQSSGEKNTQLPPQLPPDLLNSIESLKKYAKESTEGKSKFFSAEINKILLDIEIGSYGLHWGARSAIFNHLGEHLPCGKPTLLRRAKKLRETQEENQLNKPIEGLKKAIAAVMPALQEQHKLELLKAKAEVDKLNTETVKEGASTESEEDETKAESTAKKIKRPKKEFTWNSETRKYLTEIVAIKMETFKISGKSRSQTEEEYIKPFMDSSIKPLWPKGWMKTSILIKECKACNEEFARNLPPARQERMVIPSGKPWPSVGVEDSSKPSGPPSAPSSAASQTINKSKSGEMIEIANSPVKDGMGGQKDGGLRPPVRDNNTVVVDLTDHNISTKTPSSKISLPPSSLMYNSYSTTSSKVQHPPVEVIDITDSPQKPSPLLKNQQQIPHGVSTLSSSLSVQQSLINSGSSKSISAKVGKLDPVFQQAKVVLKPVCEQLHKGSIISSGAVTNRSPNQSIGSQANTAMLKKQMNIQHKVQQQQHNVVKPLGSPQIGLQKQSPLSFNTPGLASKPTVMQANRVAEVSATLAKPNTSNKQSSPQQKKGQGGVNPQQVKSGIVLGTSSTHITTRLPYATNTQGMTVPQNKPNLTTGTASHKGDSPVSVAGGRVSSKGDYMSHASPVTSSSKSPAHSMSPTNLSLSLPRSMPLKVGGRTNLSPTYRPHTDSVNIPQASLKVTAAGKPPQPSQALHKSTEKCIPPSQQPPNPGESGSRMSQFDLIQSHVQSQEAMEGLALQTLALAARNLKGLSGLKETPKSVGSVGNQEGNNVGTDKRSILPVSTNSGSGGVLKKIPKSSLQISVVNPEQLKINPGRARDGAMSGGASSVLVASSEDGNPDGSSKGVDAWQAQFQQFHSLPRNSNLSISTVSSTKAKMSKVEPIVIDPWATPDKNIFSEMQKSVSNMQHKQLLGERKSPGKSAPVIQLPRNVHIPRHLSEDSSVVTGGPDVIMPQESSLLSNSSKQKRVCVDHTFASPRSASADSNLLRHRISDQESVPEHILEVDQSSATKLVEFAQNAGSNLYNRVKTTEQSSTSSALFAQSKGSGFTGAYNNK